MIHKIKEKYLRKTPVLCVFILYQLKKCLGACVRGKNSRQVYHTVVRTEGNYGM